jgi:hypothetical protein
MVQAEASRECAARADGPRDLVRDEPPKLVRAAAVTDRAAPARRFQFARTTGGWRVEDATGQSLAYVYGDDRPQGASSHLLTVALGIARLPDLLTPPEHKTSRRDNPVADRHAPGVAGQCRR